MAAAQNCLAAVSNTFFVAHSSRPSSAFVTASSSSALPWWETPASMAAVQSCLDAATPSAKTSSALPWWETSASMAAVQSCLDDAAPSAKGEEGFIHFQWLDRGKIIVEDKYSTVQYRPELPEDYRIFLNEPHHGFRSCCLLLSFMVNCLMIFLWVMEILAGVLIFLLPG